MFDNAPADYTAGTIAYNHPEYRYRSAPGISSSMVRTIALKSPAHYQHEFFGEPVIRRESDAVTVGLMTHCLVLEPDQFEQRYPKKPQIEDYPGALRTVADMRQFCDEHNLKKTGTKAELTERIIEHDPHAPIWEQILAANERRTFKPELIDTARRMADSVLNHPDAALLFSKGDPEVSIWGVHDEQLIKCRADWLRKEDALCVDLKTTECASPSRFSRSICKYGYHLQQAHYLATINSAGIDCDTFVFVAVENQPPYVCQIYILESNSSDSATLHWRTAMQTLKECQESDTWPTYTDNTELSLPPWELSND